MTGTKKKTGVNSSAWASLSAYGVIITALMLALVFAMPPAYAKAKAARFDHIRTGFPLTGMHDRVECESCHVAGIFKGTPRQCKGCHTRDTRVNATLPPDNTVHTINKESDCGACHKTAGWPGAKFQHMGISSGCLRCHAAGGGARTAPTDGIHQQAMGRDCSDCHRSTRSFAGGATLDHSGISSGCEAAGCHATDKARARGHAGLNACQTCHSYPRWTNVRMNHGAIGGTQCKACHVRGGTAMAPPADALHANLGGQDCSGCHTTATFASATIDHSRITTGCASSSCHASDRGRAPNHAGLSSCESCHSYPSWTNVRMNHGAIGSTTCRSCHVRGGIAAGAPADTVHASIGTQDCSSCHSTSSFASARVDHSRIVTGCAAAGCHANSKPTAIYHARLVSCESCHNYPSWTNVRMNHSAISGTQCKACHVRGGVATGAPADTVHANIGTQDCSNCHSTSSFGSARIDHSQITSGCAAAGCHANTKPTALHHAGLVSCESCHRYPSWTSVRMNHSAIGTTMCKSCHMRGGIAQGPPSDSRHANLGSRDCSACHNTRDFD